MTSSDAQNHPTLPTGEQYEISGGGYCAVVTEQGATLRALSHDGVDLIVPTAVDAVPTDARGQHLLPWPNRVRDGRYVFDGQPQQLAINEVERGNAIHGLARWAMWRLVELGQDTVRQRLVIAPQDGWPGMLEALLTHHLDAGGMTVHLAARNVGTTAVPFGYAAHPYLVMTGSIDQWQVSSPFRTCAVVDERLLPVEVATVQGSTDLSDTTLGERHLDTAFTGGPGGSWQIQLRCGAERRVLWADEHFGWVQIYTPDDRSSLAVEPMTCGPDAFNEGPTHDSMLRLEPGSGVEMRWGIHL